MAAKPLKDFWNIFVVGKANCMGMRCVKGAMSKKIG
jgi:hypothetical protein